MRFQTKSYILLTISGLLCYYFPLVDVPMTLPVVLLIKCCKVSFLLFIKTLLLFHFFFWRIFEIKMAQERVTTILRGIGDITSLIFNPHDECFYGCELTSKTIVKIKGIWFLYLSLILLFLYIYLGETYSQFYIFEGNEVPIAIDYYINDRSFIIAVDGPTPSIYSMPVNGIIHVLSIIVF